MMCIDNCSVCVYVHPLFYIVNHAVVQQCSPHNSSSASIGMIGWVSVGFWLFPRNKNKTINRAVSPPTSQIAKLSPAPPPPQTDHVGLLPPPISQLKRTTKAGASPTTPQIENTNPPTQDDSVENMVSSHTTIREDRSVSSHP